MFKFTNLKIRKHKYDVLMLYDVAINASINRKFGKKVTRQGVEIRFSCVCARFKFNRSPVEIRNVRSRGVKEVRAIFVAKSHHLPPSRI